MKTPELTDEQFNTHKKPTKHIGWFFWLQFVNDPENTFAAEDDEHKIHEFYSLPLINEPFGAVYHDDGTKITCQTIEDYLNELGKMWMIRGRKWNKQIVGYGYRKAYIEI